MEYAQTTRRVLDSAQTWLNAFGLGICWIASLSLYLNGRRALLFAGPLPTNFDSLLEALNQPRVLLRLEYYATGALELVVAFVLVVSAIEGSWWLVRRLSSE